MTTRICILVFILIALFPKWCLSEGESVKTATISGFVKDSRNGETLTGAVIYPEENPAIGIATNSYGYFSLTLPIGKYSLIIQFLGYKTQRVPLDLKENLQLTFEMEEESIALKEITLMARRLATY